MDVSGRRQIPTVRIDITAVPVPQYAGYPPTYIIKLYLGS